MKNDKSIGIIHYGCGNIHNLIKCFKKIGYTNIEVVESGNLASYDIVVLPGVGSFHNAMECIKLNGYIEQITDHVNKGKKLLGICLGMQLMLSSGEESGEIEGLNIFKGKVVKMSNVGKMPLPHVGLNKVTNLSGNYYFDHSYVVHIDDSTGINLGETRYSNENFVSMIRKNNVVGVQFHPELSGEVGLNFLKTMLLEE